MKNVEILKRNTENIFYYINDKNKNKRWIFPSGLKYPSFLNLYNTNSFKGKIYKLIVKVIFKLKLQKYFVSGSMNGELEDKYLNIISELNCTGYSIFTGTAGENRKVIIEVNKDSKTKYFIKIPTTQSAKGLVKSEKKNIHYLEQFNFKIFNFPEVVYSDDEIITISNIKPQTISNIDKFSTIHFLVLQELYDNTARNLLISEVELLQKSTEYLDILNKKQFDLNNHLDTKISQLSIQLLKIKDFFIDKEKNIEVSFAHCDFTPWNMYLSGDKLYVYDWELASHDTPLLFDFFHYIFQESVLIKHLKYNDIKNIIESSFENKILKKIITKYRIDTNQYYAYYLYINISYYTLKYANQKDLHLQAYWLIDVWNESLEDLIKNKGKVFEFN